MREIGTPSTFLRGESTRDPRTRPPTRPAAAAPPATSGAFALPATVPTEPATDWTTPLLPLEEVLRELPPLDERPFFEAVLREPLLFARVLFARVLEPEAVRLERVRFDAAVERLELEERFGADDPLLLRFGLLVLLLDLVLLLFERALDDERLELLSAMESHPFRGLC